MLNKLLGTKTKNIISILMLNAILGVYTIFMAQMIRSSEYSITVYFFMMLFWFLLIVISGATETVLVGDMIFDPYWKKEEILLQRLTKQEQLARKDFKDYKIRFRIILVLIIGANIFLFNRVSDNIFDFYNKVGLKFSQLKYDNEKKQVEAIESLYHLQDPTYRKEMLNRIKKTIETSKYNKVKSWGIWYIKKRGSIKDIDFIRSYLKSTGPEIVADSASAIYDIYVKEAEIEAKKRYSEGDDLKLLTEQVKVERKIFSPDFEYAKEIEAECKRVDYPRDCLLTVAAFDGRESFNAIINKSDKIEDYTSMIWILANTTPATEEARKKVDELFEVFYKKGKLEHKCLVTVGIGKLKSLNGQKMLIDDFYNQKNIQCPRINQENKGADDYILARPDLLQVKILDAMSSIEDLRLETRKFLYSLTTDKKLNYKVRAKSVEVYDKLEKLFRSQEK
jgi:hypothetical protein